MQKSFVLAGMLALGFVGSSQAGYVYYAGENVLKNPDDVAADDSLGDVGTQLNSGRVDPIGGSYSASDPAFTSKPGGGSIINIPTVTAAYSAFSGALSGQTVNGFESATVGANTGILLDFGAVNATLTSDGTLFGVTESPAGTETIIGRYATAYPGAGDSEDAGRFFHVGKSAQTDWSLTIAFDAAVDAFGFFATDVGDDDGQLYVVLNGDTLNPVALTHNIIPNSSGTGLLQGSLNFFGIVGDAGSTITSVTIYSIGGISGEPIGIDNLVVGSLAPDTPVVPEPASFALAGCGLLSLAALRRRKA